MRHALLIACLALSACASPAVDITAPNFSEAKYASDLDECRGGTALTAAAKGLGGAVVGSFVGAAQGAFYGAIQGDSKEGAVIGVAVGSVVGFVVGTYKPIKEADENVGQCLSGKGYSLL